MIGKEAGICWDSDTSDNDKNVKRAINCIKSNHGRTLEYPQVYMVIEGYSARVIRELYTHIGGSPSRLQSSTRYIDYESGFSYVTPPSIKKNLDTEKIYDECMLNILSSMQTLEEHGIPREDIALLLPLGMTTKVVLRTNLRNLIDMSRSRMCTRAYWEFRSMFGEISKALSEYSNEWDYIVKNCFKPTCEELGYCPENKSCGRKKSEGIKWRS